MSYYTANMWLGRLKPLITKWQLNFRRKRCVVLFTLLEQSDKTSFQIKPTHQRTLKSLYENVFINWNMLHNTVEFSRYSSEEGKGIDGKSDQNRRCEFWVINCIVLFIEEQIDGYASTPLENISMDSTNQSF